MSVTDKFKTAVTGAATATYDWSKSFFGDSAFGPVACVSLPLVLSVSTLQSIANKDSMNNYTILWLIFGASYLIGALGYILILLWGVAEHKEQILYLLLFLVMVCFSAAVASGGVATLVVDAQTTVNSNPSP
jgi:hypothetical protein